MKLETLEMPKNCTLCGAPLDNELGTLCWDCQKLHGNPKGHVDTGFGGAVLARAVSARVFRRGD